MRPYRVANVLRENETTHTLLFDGRLPEAQPGQFVMAWLPEIGGETFQHPCERPAGIDDL